MEQTEPINQIRRYIEFIVLIALVLIYGWVTYQRDFIWKDNFSLWGDCIKKSPQKYRPHNNLGLAYLEKKDYDRAMAEFRETLRLKPTAEKAYLNIGQIYEEKGQIEDAIYNYKKALEISPNFTGALHFLGNIYEKQGLLDTALLYYEKAWRIKQDNPKLLVSLGSVLQKKDSSERLSITIKWLFR